MGVAQMNRVKSEPEFYGSLIQHEKLDTSAPPGWEIQPGVQGFEDTRSPNALSTGRSSTSALEQAQSPAEDTSFPASPLCPAPLCRQFWKAGNYDDELASSKSRVQNSQNYLHVHPKFLHSNATSHKWAFGAIAELLDNAIDEIQNGATFVIVDKILNPRDGSPALLIQDDGGGMDPEAVRRCMSFGFSDKKSKSAIGRYGNGFKTSTMRLGADVIVFSRHMGDRTLTQSIGLLSYTFLSRKGLDRIVVPMVDYEYNVSTSTFEPLHRFGKEYFESNIANILQWSPYSSKAELMKQFDDIGSHGTKVIVYNLWLTDDGTLEFDFESDSEDIRLHGYEKSEKSNSKMAISDEHIGNQYRYSLRLYLSILYLRIPQNFSMILRGKVVQHHSIAHDLKFPEFIMYRPQTGGTKEEIVTTIGFLKEAPHVYLHGFNVYHKNRLILPFWHVVNYSDSRGRGVVGVLEANFVEPTHNKQDFERTSLFQKLETRLKEMTWEYWDYHCGLIGYQVKKKTRAPVTISDSSHGAPDYSRRQPVSMNKSSNFGPALVSLPAGPVLPNSQSNKGQHGAKRTQDDLLSALGRVRRKYKEVPVAADRSLEVQPAIDVAKPINQQEAVVLMQENKKLQAKCLEHEKTQDELNYKVSRLKRELEEVQQEYVKMLNELQTLEAVKPEK